MSQDLKKIVEKLEEVLELAAKVQPLLISDSDLYQLKGVRTRLVNKIEKLSEKEPV